MHCAFAALRRILVKLALRRLATPLGLILLTFLLACNQPQTPATGSPAEVASNVRTLSLNWMLAINAKDIDKTLFYYAPDATVYPPGAAAATTPDQRRQVWTEEFAQPGFRLDVTASSVEAAASGDLAVETGSFILSAYDKQGKPFAMKGKYVCVWKHQKDGSWKAYQEIWNANQ